MNKQMLKQMISNELDLLFKTDHWGTEDQITIENIILAKQSGMECLSTRNQSRSITYGYTILSNRKVRQ